MGWGGRRSRGAREQRGGGAEEAVLLGWFRRLPEGLRAEAVAYVQSLVDGTRTSSEERG